VETDQSIRDLNSDPRPDKDYKNKLKELKESVYKREMKRVMESLNE